MKEAPLDKRPPRFRVNFQMILRSRVFNHVVPFLAFAALTVMYFGRMHSQYIKEPQGRTKAYTFKGVFLAGRYDQGIYRGIGAVGYEDGKRVGWYPGAAIPGGIAWRLMGRPLESEGGKVPFRMGFYVPSILAGLVFFYCFYRFAYLKWGTGVGLWSLFSLIAFPSSFYYLTAFPYNLGLACMTAYLLVYESKVRGRYLWLGFLSFYCSLTYPTALLFAAYPLLTELTDQVEKRRVKLLPYVVYGLPFALGVMAFYTHLHFAVGDFFAYVHHQGNHHSRDWGNPFSAVIGYFREFPVVKAENVTAILVALYFALFACRRLGIALWGYMLILLIFSPMTGTFACAYRHYLFAFPLHYMLGLSAKHASVKTTFLLICAFIGLRHFFMLYMAGVLL